MYETEDQAHKEERRKEQNTAHRMCSITTNTKPHTQ
jgi:hypothetical protein